MESCEIYKETVRQWGELPQIDQLCEEAGAMIAAAMRHRRAEDCDQKSVATARLELLNKLAGVSIMIEQTLDILDGYNEHETLVDLKLSELKSWLELGRQEPELEEAF